MRVGSFFLILFLTLFLLQAKPIAIVEVDASLVNFQKFHHVELEVLSFRMLLVLLVEVGDLLGVFLVFDHFIYWANCDYIQKQCRCI